MTFTKKEQSISRFAQRAFMINSKESMRAIIRFRFTFEFYHDYLLKEFPDLVSPFQIFREYSVDLSIKEVQSRGGSEDFSCLRPSSSHSDDSDISPKSVSYDQVDRDIAQNAKISGIKDNLNFEMTLSSISCETLADFLKSSYFNVFIKMVIENQALISTTSSPVPCTESHQWLNDLIVLSNILPVGFTVADMTLSEVNLIFVNYEFTQITQYSKEYAVGKKCSFLQGPDTTRESIMTIRNSLGRGENCEVLIRNYRKDGNEFLNHLFLHPIFDSNGVYKYVIGIQLEVIEGSQKVDVNFMSTVLAYLPSTIKESRPRSRKVSTRDTNSNVSFLGFITGNNEAGSSPTSSNLLKKNSSYEFRSTTKSSSLRIARPRTMSTGGNTQSHSERHASTISIVSSFKPIIERKESNEDHFVAKSELPEPSNPETKDSSKQKPFSSVFLDATIISFTKIVWGESPSNFILSLLNDAAGNAAFMEYCSKESILWKRMAEYQKTDTSYLKVIASLVCWSFLDSSYCDNLIMKLRKRESHSGSGSGEQQQRQTLRTVAYGLNQETDSFWLDMFKVVSELSSIGMVVTDMTRPGVQLSYVNESFHRITGYGKEKIGHNCRFLQGGDTEQSVIDEIREAVQQRKAAVVKVTNYRSDGEKFKCLLALHPVSGPSPEYRYKYMIGLHADLSSPHLPASLEDMLDMQRILRYLPHSMADMEVRHSNGQPTNASSSSPSSLQTASPEVDVDLRYMVTFTKILWLRDPSSTCKKILEDQELRSFLVSFTQQVNHHHLAQKNIALYASLEQLLTTMKTSPPSDIRLAVQRSGPWLKCRMFSNIINSTNASFDHHDWQEVLTNVKVWQSQIIAFLVESFALSEFLQHRYSSDMIVSLHQRNLKGDSVRLKTAGYGLNQETDSFWLDMFKVVSELSSIGMVVTDMTRPGVQLSYVNEGFHRITGYGKEKIGHNCRFLQGGDTEQSVIDEIREAVQQRKAAVVKITNYRSDGEKFKCLLALHPVSGPSPEYRYKYMIGLYVDCDGAQFQSQLLDFIRISEYLTLFRREESPQGNIKATSPVNVEANIQPISATTTTAAATENTAAAATSSTDRGGGRLLRSPTFSTLMPRNQPKELEILQAQASFQIKTIPRSSFTGISGHNSGDLSSPPSMFFNDEIMVDVSHIQVQQVLQKSSVTVSTTTAIDLIETLGTLGGPGHGNAPAAPAAAPAAAAASESAIAMNSNEDRKQGLNSTIKEHTLEPPTGATSTPLSPTSPPTSTSNGLPRLASPLPPKSPPGHSSSSLHEGGGLAASRKTSRAKYVDIMTAAASTSVMTSPPITERKILRPLSTTRLAVNDYHPILSASNHGASGSNRSDSPMAGVSPSSPGGSRTGSRRHSVIRDQVQVWRNSSRSLSIDTEPTDEDGGRLFSISAPSPPGDSLRKTCTSPLMRRIL